MEAASLTLPAERRSLVASMRDRRRERHARRLLADADRFDRAAGRLESQLDSHGWQVRQLRCSAEQLRELALAEQQAA